MPAATYCVSDVIVRNVPLKLGLDDHTGYAGPVNLNFLGSPYLFYGFIPTNATNNADVFRGLKVSDISLALAVVDSDFVGTLIVSAPETQTLSCH